MQIVSNASLIAAQAQKVGGGPKPGARYGDAAVENSRDVQARSVDNSAEGRRSAPVDRVDVDTKALEKRLNDKQIAEAQNVRRREKASETRAEQAKEQEARQDIQNHRREAPRAGAHGRAVPPGAQVNLVV